MPVHLMASGRLVRLEQVAGCGRWTSRSAMGGKSAALHPCAHCDITTQQQFKLRAWASTSGEAGVQSKDPRFCCGSSVLQRSALLHPSGPQLPPILEFSPMPIPRFTAPPTPSRQKRHFVLLSFNPINSNTPERITCTRERSRIARPR